MKPTRRELLRATVLAAVLPTLPHLAGAQQPRTVRIRGTVTAMSDSRVTVKQRNGDTLDVATAPDVRLTEVYPVTLADVKPGTFVGVGGMPQSDGSQRAIAVVLFPENMRSFRMHVREREICCFHAHAWLRAKTHGYWRSFDSAHDSPLRSG